MCSRWFLQWKLTSVYQLLRARETHTNAITVSPVRNRYTVRTSTDNYPNWVHTRWCFYLQYAVNGLESSLAWTVSTTLSESLRIDGLIWAADAVDVSGASALTAKLTLCGLPAREGIIDSAGSATPRSRVDALVNVAMSPKSEQITACKRECRQPQHTHHAPQIGISSWFLTTETEELMTFSH